MRLTPKQAEAAAKIAKREGAVELSRGEGRDVVVTTEKSVSTVGARGAVKS